MHTDYFYTPLIPRKLAFRIHLTQREHDTLKHAADVMADVRERLEQEHGEDDAYDVTVAQDWIRAESYLYSALDSMIANRIETRPAEDN